MNYIPGFSNHLQQFAKGGRAEFVEEDTYGDAAPIMDTYQPAATMPAATMPAAVTSADAAPPYTLSGLTPEALAGLYALSSSSAFNQGNYGSDFGSLDNVYGMNFGSDLGSGGSGGSLYKVNPYLQTIAAPLSDKGNSTAYGGGGIEVKSPTQTFRLLDKNTGKVVYEGVGYEGAQEAIDRASALTAKEGAKAQWQIQTPNSQQESGYSVVANEKRSQSTLGDIASVALPIGMALLTGGMSLPAQMAAAGIAGAAGAGLAGKDPAKAGLISAATAGIMGGTGANEAIGRAVGNVGGTLAAKATEEVAKTAAEKAAEQIIVTGLSKAAQGAGSAIGNTLLSQGVKSGLSSVTGYKTPAEKFAEQPLPNTTTPAADIYAGLDPINVTALSKLTQGAGNAIGNTLSSQAGNEVSRALSGYKTPAEKFAEQPLPEAFQPPVDMYAGLDPINVTALSKLTQGAGNAIGNTVGNTALSEAVKGPLSEVASAEQPKTAEEIEAEKNPIVVKAYRPINPVGGFDPTSVSKDLTDLGKSVSAGLPALTELAMDPTLADPADGDIVVTGTKTVPKTVVPDVLTAVGPILPQLVTPKVPEPDPKLTQTETNKLGLEEYLRLLALAAGLGGGGGSSQPSRYGGSGSGRLNPIFSAKLPAAGGLGTIGATRTPRTLGDVDWLTYGTRPELDFFDYARPAAAPVTTPVPGNPAGPIMATPAAGMIPAPEQILTPAQLAALEKQRLDQYAYLSQFTPTAEELARNTALYGNNEAADPIMTADEPRPMMAKGGAFAAKRGGASKRTEFAVSGPGTGRSDDIPAVLSDGEYVIDAETVALLGDGSSKAGAKKLDELRVKVRKHKGRKLAKGRFSANAKNPEAYLSGGRV
jgi:hypothetical protein